MVLTAAHNIYGRPQQWQYSSFKFYLGANGKAKQYYQVQAVRYPLEFKNLNSDKLFNDFAILKLKTQVEFDQFLKLSVPCKTCLEEKNSRTQLQIYGFPGRYRENYKAFNKNGQQFKLYQYGLSRKDRIVVIDPSKCKIGYAISTLPGQSGCPVVVNQNIVAVHNGGGNQSEEFNVARIVDIPMLITLDNWCKQLKGSTFQINRQNLCPHLKLMVQRQYLKKIEEKQKEMKLELVNKGLKEIDLSKEIQVTHLDLGGNKLSAIEVSRNINLTQLNLSYNQLSAIDVSRNINLTELYLWDNQLSAIDVSRNINLTQLYLSHNQLSAIDVSRNINLTQLNLSYNQLSAIDVSRNINLTELYLWDNQLSAIDVSRNISLTQLDLRQNQLSAIDVSRNINLTKLWLQYNSLKSIFVCFSQKLQYTHFSDQKSAACQIQLLYSEGEFEKCSQRIKKWSEEYRKGGQRNDYGCNYAFVAQKRG